MSAEYAQFEKGEQDWPAELTLAFLCQVRVGLDRNDECRGCNARCPEDSEAELGHPVPIGARRGAIVLGKCIEEHRRQARTAARPGVAVTASAQVVLGGIGIIGVGSCH